MVTIMEMIICLAFPPTTIYFRRRKNVPTEIYSTKVNKYVSSVSSISYVRNKMVKRKCKRF